jgi:hypothetical protein
MDTEQHQALKRLFEEQGYNTEILQTSEARLQRQ